MADQAEEKQPTTKDKLGKIYLITNIPIFILLYYIYFF